MRNKVSNIVLGLVFLAVGVGYLGDVLNFWKFSLFFDGWWTLFIIIPCVCSMISQGIQLSNIVGLGIGILLLLSAQNIVSYEIVWKIFVPLLFIIIGVKIIFSNFFQHTIKQIPEGHPNLYALFSGSEQNYSNQEFRGATCSAIFGGVDLNLKNAIIQEDCAIHCNAIFGGIDILLPPNIKANVVTNPIMGGVENHFISSLNDNAPTVYINATCILGGIEIK